MSSEGGGTGAESSATLSSENGDIPSSPFSKLCEIPSEDSLESIIPQKIQVGFRNVEVVITAIDSNDVFVLCGTNAGYGFLYNRETGHLMKIACEARTDIVATVKLFIGIECQCAVGTSDGKILIIIISSGSAPNTRRVKKFCLGPVHSSEVRCLEWSTNGLRLFSGDKDGNVYVTEREFQKEQCHVSSLLKEENEIVDLSYKHKVLLISTTERSLIFDSSLSDNQKIPIGSKSRKGVYSSCFGPDSSTASDLQIYCTRPGYRIWTADVKGIVKMTLLFKDLVASSSSEIILLNSTGQVVSRDNQFRKLKFFQEKYLLASSDSSIFLIDPTVPIILASCQNFDGVLNVSVTKTEIFVLCKNRKIYRISEERDELAHRRRKLEEKNMSESMKKLQNMKNSFTTNFSFQALQSKMSNFNEEAEQWSSKIHSQAKAFQQKLPTISTSLFSRDNKTEGSEQHSESIAVTTTSDPASSQSPMRTSASEAENDVKEQRMKDIDCERVNQDDNSSEPTPTSVNLYFEKMKEIGSQEINEIVFESRRKRTKPRSSSFRHDSLSDETEKSLPKTTSRDLTESPTLWRRLPNSEKDQNINGAHVAEVGHNDVMGITVSQEQNIDFSSAVRIHDHHDQENVPHDTEINGDGITISERIETTVSHTSQDNVDADTQKNQAAMPTSLNDHRKQRSVPHDTEINVGEITTADPTTDDDDDQTVLPTANEGVEDTEKFYPESTAAESKPELCAEDYAVTLPTPIRPTQEEATQPISIMSRQGLSEEYSIYRDPACIPTPLDKYSPLNSKGAHADSVHSGGNPVVASLNQHPSSEGSSKDDVSHDSAEFNDNQSSSSDDIYAVDTATRDFESELDSDDEFFKEDTPLSEAVQPKKVVVSSTLVNRRQYQDKKSVPGKLLDCWSTISLPHRVSSISASGNYIWYIDHYSQIYLAEEVFGKAAIKWRKLKQTGTKLYISPSGDIIWCLGKNGTVYAATMPTDLHLFEEPLNFCWGKVTSNISCFTLGHGNAWVVTSGGVVKSQLNLTRQKCFADTWNLISWPQENGKILDIAVTKTMVWCRTDQSSLCRAGIEDAHENNAVWEQVLGSKESTSAILNFSSDGIETIFLIDQKGVMSFISEDGKIWQFNVSEFMDEEQNLLAKSFVQSLPTHVASSVNKMQRWMVRPIEGQLIAVSNQSIWIVHGKCMAAVAKGPITGHKWDFLTPLGVTKSSKWRRITTSSVFSSDLGSWLALVWASRPNGEIFCFSSQDVASSRPVALPPATLSNSPIVCMSACKDALWVLYESGEIYIRSGITDNRLQGTEWNLLDTNEQLGDVKITHISCGTQHVWAVGSKGQVYFRIGVGFVDRNSLQPAWIPVDGCDVSGRYFTVVECDLSDSSIWAIDNFSEIYVRLGVSVDMPIGTKWETVPGSQARQLCISNHTVWGLRKSGNLIRRFGISQRNQMGNYWKKVIGSFVQIAATPYDELWAIDEAERLRHLSTNAYCPIVVEAQYQFDDSDKCIDEDFTFPENVEKDWEIL